MAKLIRNRVTERDIRDWLQSNGYEGGSATLESVELYAIKRPGWEQLFRFTGRIRRQSDDADETPPKLDVWGIALDDERERGEKTQVVLCDSAQQQEQHLEELSADMLKTTRSADRGAGVLVLLTFFVLGLIIISLFALARHFNG